MEVSGPAFAAASTAFLRPVILRRLTKSDCHFDFVSSKACCGKRPGGVASCFRDREQQVPVLAMHEVAFCAVVVRGFISIPLSSS